MYIDISAFDDEDTLTDEEKEELFNGETEE